MKAKLGYKVGIHVFHFVFNYKKESESFTGEDIFLTFIEVGKSLQAQGLLDS